MIHDLFFGQRTKIISGVVIFVLCLLAYGNSLNNGFLLDDHYLLFEDGGVKDLPSNASLFIENFRGFYRPLGVLFIKYCYLLFGTNAIGYHVVNLLLFFFIGWLFFFLVHNLTADFKISLLTSSFFCVHPINNMLVNYKTASMLSLFIIFMQLSMLFFLWFTVKGKKIFYSFSLLFYFLALLSHEVSFLVPLYLFFTMYFLRGFPLKKNLRLCLPFCGVFLIYFFIRSHIADLRPIDSIIHLGISWSNYLSIIMQLFNWYFSKLIFPQNLLFLWDVSTGRDHFAGIRILELISLLIVLFLVIFTVWRRGVKPFSLALFAVGLLPLFVASFVYTPIMDTAIVEPHWFYFSSIGFFTLAAYFLVFLSKKVNFKIWIAGICIFFSFLTFLTRKSNAVWKSEETYCTYWTELNPLNGSAWDCRAEVYIEKNDKGLDKNQYQDCGEIADIAGAYHLYDESPKAVQYYAMALEKDPNCVKAFYGLGNLYLDYKEFEKAEQAFLAVVKNSPTPILGYKKLIEVYEKQGETEKADKIKELIQ